MVADCYGESEITDAVAVTIAAGWMSPAGLGKTFSDLVHTGVVAVDDLIMAVGDAHDWAIRHGEPVEELDLLGTWGVNHPSRDPKRYAVCVEDGIGSGVLGPDGREPQFTSRRAARAYFASWLIDSGNDYTRAAGFGAPTAWLYPAAEWDGISYGSEGYGRFERGPRGGITWENA